MSASWRAEDERMVIIMWKRFILRMINITAMLLVYIALFVGIVWGCRYSYRYAYDYFSHRTTGVAQIQKGN